PGSSPRQWHFRAASQLTNLAIRDFLRWKGLTGQSPRATVGAGVVDEDELFFAACGVSSAAELSRKVVCGAQANGRIRGHYGKSLNLALRRSPSGRKPVLSPSSADWGGRRDRLGGSRRRCEAVAPLEPVPIFRERRA